MSGTPSTLAKDSTGLLRTGSGNQVPVNSCPNCNGGRVCDRCLGSGTYVDGPCYRCNETGICQDCRSHCEELVKFATDLQQGQLHAAEAALMRALNLTVEEESGSRTAYAVGGMGAGALIGTILFPGVGTVIGGWLGKAMGDGAANSDAPHMQAWKRADLYYCLGALYLLCNRKSEASQAWIKALTYKDDHEPTRKALKEVF